MGGSRHGRLLFQSENHWEVRFTNCLQDTVDGVPRSRMVSSPFDLGGDLMPVSRAYRWRLIAETHS
jgi:hypothetical protein